MDAPERIFRDSDGDACLAPEGRENNLVACPAVDENGLLLNPAVWDRMIYLFNNHDLLVAEAVAKERERWMTKKNGGQAFPRAIGVSPHGTVRMGEPGMTLRDYAMVHLVSSAMTTAVNLSSLSDDDLSSVCAETVRLCGFMADAMLAERIK